MERSRSTTIRRTTRISSRLLAAVSPLGWAVVLGIASGAWVVDSAIAPQIAQAYTARASVSIDSGTTGAFETLLRRAEIAARAAVQRSFDADLLATAVSVTVVGENGGLAAPILTVEVTRPQWRQRPEPSYWATYYGSARSLLGYGGGTSTTATAEPPAPVQQPTAPSQNTAPTQNGVPTQPLPTPEGSVNEAPNNGSDQTPSPIDVFDIPPDVFTPSEP